MWRDFTTKGFFLPYLLVFLIPATATAQNSGGRNGSSKDCGYASHLANVSWNINHDRGEIFTAIKVILPDGSSHQKRVQAGIDDEVFYFSPMDPGTVEIHFTFERFHPAARASLQLNLPYPSEGEGTVSAKTQPGAISAEVEASVEACGDRRIADEHPSTAEELRFIEASMEAEIKRFETTESRDHPFLPNPFEIKTGPKPFDPEAMATCIDRSMYEAGVASYSYAIVQSGKLKKSRGVGWARAPWETQAPSTPMTTSQRMTVASISKPVTAVGIMKLVEEGQLSLGDFFYPLVMEEFLDVGQGVSNITVRQLLSHTSGLQVSNCEGIADTVAASASGNSYQYNNANYCLLRKVIEHVTGEDYVDYIQSEILNPMNINSMSCAKISNKPTLYYSSVGEDEGYLWPDYSSTCGAYGWYASVIDLAKFLAHFRYNTVLTPTTEKQMLTDCPSTKRCLSWAVKPGAKGPYYTHSGDWHTADSRGFLGSIVGFPWAVDAVLFTNTYGNFNTEHILVDAFELSFKNGCIPPPKPANPSQCPESGCGTKVNFACAQVGEYADGSFTPISSKPFRSQNNPDGASAYDKYCVDFPEILDYVEGAPEAEMVCAEAVIEENTYDVCKSCADGSQWPGCSCDPFNQDSCGPGLSCYPSTGYDTYNSFSTGRCWETVQGPPAWECEADCHNIYGDLGYCHRGALPWEGTGTPICASKLCDLNGIECAQQGLFCNVHSGQCEVECNGLIHKPNQGQYSCEGRGYPPEFSCNVNAQRCFIDGVMHP